MRREPHWQGPGETNWGLSPYRWGAAFTDSVREMPRILGTIGLRASYIRTRRMLHRIDGPRLALGSGSNPPVGWYGLDLFRQGPRVRQADLLLGIPAVTGTASAVLAEHILEHLYLDDLPGVLTECRRVLRRGGVIRVVSPDATSVARLLQLGPAAEAEPMVVADTQMHHWNADGLNWARAINRISHQWGQHRSLLTADLTARLLELSGFQGIKALPSTQTRYFNAGPPDVHAMRFPDENPSANFAIEALAP